MSELEGPVGLTREGYNALDREERDRLKVRVGELERALSAERAERDALREEVTVLRACVSSHLHGTAQELANAYARLRTFDKARGKGAR